MQAQWQHQMHLIKSVSSICCQGTAVCEAHLPAPSHHVNHWQEKPRGEWVSGFCVHENHMDAGGVGHNSV